MTFIRTEPPGPASYQGPPEAMAFDLYGTLVDTASVAPACERAFQGRGADLSCLWRAKQLEYTWLLNSMGEYLDFWEVSRRALEFTCRSLGLPQDPRAERTAMEALFELAPFPDAAPALAQLSGREVPLAVLSNGTVRMVERAIESAGLAGMLGPVLSVDAVRAYKPDPRVYRMAAERIGLPPERIAFVSGNAWDAAGAASSGLRTVWVNRSGGPPEGIGGAASEEVSSLTDLAAALWGRGN